MQSFPSLLRSVTRILFWRGSPERIQIEPWTLPVSLLLAAVAYGLVHWWLFQLSGAQTALSLFCFVSLLAAAMSWITRYVPRRRLFQVLVAMLVMIALCGGVLALLGLVPAFPYSDWLALPVALVLLYGLSHALGFALKCPQPLAALWCLLFAAVVYGLYRLLDQQLEIVFAQLVPGPLEGALWISLRG